jgi:putative membrane protein
MFKQLATRAAIGAVLLIAPLQAFAQTQQQQPNVPAPDYYWGPGRMMWGGGYWGGNYGWPFWEMIPMMLLLTILVCIVIFYFARATFGGHHAWTPAAQTPNDTVSSALQILNERFARGEIQKNEFEEKKAAILAGARR